MGATTGEPVRQLSSLFVANRGEIAVRIIRAARDLGLRCAVPCAAWDAAALHARLADDVVLLAGDDVDSTYLDADALVAAARAAGADGVHPGYGFLSEDHHFARAVLAAGMVWVGPDPETIEALGDKVTARRLAASVGAPLLPGTEDVVSSAEAVEEFAARHGLPLVIKAAHGGGGRGLVVVREVERIGELFESATREAKKAFGRGECFVERYLDRARHVEVQILADGGGTVVAVGTRDCSLQRRNQKLVEEAPAPFLAEEVEVRIRAAAKAICAAARYVGVGTVEFLVGSGGEVAFLEVNTRLQVEHTVTEETTGLDLVREQLRIATGCRLRPGLDAPAVGHAIELRLTSEDAAHGFLPVSGVVNELKLPAGPGVRVDAGIESGDRIDPRFDSMFAKVIVRGSDRAETLERARRALAELRVVGVPTLQSLYRAILDRDEFVARDGRFGIHNRWIEQELASILPAPVTAVADGSERLAVPVGRKRLAVHLPGVSASRPATRDFVERTRRGGVGSCEDPTDASVRAPMQGTVIQLLVVEGCTVAIGDAVAVLEAMKMEHRLLAACAGVVRRISVDVGDAVAQGTVLCEIEALTEEST